MGDFGFGELGFGNRAFLVLSQCRLECLWVLLACLEGVFLRLQGGFALVSENQNGRKWLNAW